jgi:hypothetical protein
MYSSLSGLVFSAGPLKPDQATVSLSRWLMMKGRQGDISVSLGTTLLALRMDVR